MMTKWRMIQLKLFEASFMEMVTIGIIIDIEARFLLVGVICFILHYKNSGADLGGEANGHVPLLSILKVTLITEVEWQIIMTCEPNFVCFLQT